MRCVLRPGLRSPSTLRAVKTMAGTAQDLKQLPRWWDENTIAVVSGANKGIGLEIARQLADLGMHVVLGSRDAERGKEAVRNITLQNSAAKVECAALDITDEATVTRLVGDLRAREGKEVAVLVNNAGIAFKGDTWGAEEARQTIETNLRGTRRMTEAMMPLLTPHARVVNVSSRAGLLSIFAAGRAEATDRIAREGSVQDVDGVAEDFLRSVADGSYADKGFPRSMYGVSKALENAYTRVVAREAARDCPGLLVAAMCPGWCATDMSSWRGPRSAAQGADTAVWLCVAPEESIQTGQFWADRQRISW